MSRGCTSTGVLAVVGLLLAGCGSPMEPTPGAPTIACPANVTVRGVPGGTQPVTFPAPVVTGGAAPVNVTCTPGSGAPFTVGTTGVACTAVDAKSRQAQCSFSVTLTPLLLSVTKFVAFGDSFTEGEDGRTARLGFGFAFIDPTGTYPVLLQTLLNNEYPGQSIVVLNRGRSGEFVDEGRQRLPNVIATDRPGALLLLEGYNDLLGSCRPKDATSAQCATTTTEVVAGMRKMIQTAKTPTYGISYVFVSTLTPPGPYISGTDRRIAGTAIIQTNTKLASMARAEGAILVDPYPVFVGHESEYVADDGLHLRRAGYQALADTFFAAIKNTVTSTPGFGAIH